MKARAWLALLGCGACAMSAPPRRPPDDAAADGPPALSCGDTPSARNWVMPVFGPIFNGDFPLLNHFDHDLPQGFDDHNGRQLDWCGRTRTSEIDGHTGYDFAMPEGTPVLAPAYGIVSFAGQDGAFFCPLKDQEVSDQLRVTIHHPLEGRAVMSTFKHLSRVIMQLGQLVEAGDVVGLSGNTGCSTTPHLHYETWLLEPGNTKGPVLIDPFGWEGLEPDPWESAPDGLASRWLWKPGKAPKIW